MDQQQNQIISLIAVFLALGIGILIGASMGEEALVLHQIDFIEELKNEITHYKEEIDIQFLSYLQLQEELSVWESLESAYFNPHFIEDKLIGTNINVIALESVEKELLGFLQKSGCSFATIFLTGTDCSEDQLLMHNDSQIFIVSGYPDTFLSEAFAEVLKQRGKLVIRVAVKDNALNVTDFDTSFPVIYSIDKFHNRIKLLELIQEYVQKGSGV